ncbi:hypothetical protein BSKO_01157 [Bryopsis sp. KO-2023]|nr:hypothetical protein BSKO_01157 [Bryopsis sp. KO-2023]
MSEQETVALSLLPFRDVWNGCVSRAFLFESALKAEEAINLEALRHVSSLRRRSVENRSFELLEQIETLQEYWFHLQDLLSKEEEYAWKDGKSKLIFEWNSPLGFRDVISHRLFGLGQEGIMVLFLCGCGFREKAFAGANQMVSDGAPNATDVAVMFREAAGFFKHLAEMHASLEEDLPADRPAESVAAMSSCFENICLAEAQGIVAYRAAEKGTSPSVVAALHRGASDLFEEASKILRENTGEFNVVSDRLKRFIAISSSVQTSRALQYMARDQILQEQGGKAVRCCQEARDNLRDCLIVAEGSIEWISRLKLENDGLKELEASCERDRASVFMQPLASMCPEMVEGKILAKHIPYTPKKWHSIL